MLVLAGYTKGGLEELERLDCEDFVILLDLLPKTNG